MNGESSEGTHPEDSPGHIVVGVDGSAPSGQALLWARFLAHITDTTIDAVTVWPPRASYGLSGDLNPHKVVTDTLDRVFGEQRPPGLRIVVREGTAAKVLLEVSTHSRMLVVGSRGRGGIAGLLLGSVSAACVEQATCPVLAVHGTTPRRRSPEAKFGARDVRCDGGAGWPYSTARPVGNPISAARLRTVVVLLVVLLGVWPASSAQANGTATTEARLYVLQSVALIANDASVAVVAERITDALNAPDTAGTDLAKVKQALAIVEGSAPGAAGATDRNQARGILASAVDVRAATGYGTLPPPGELGQDTAPYATGAGTGTAVVLDGFRPARGVSDRGDLVLLVLSGLAIALGVYLSLRWRPPDTLRELRRRSSAVKDF